MTGDIQHDATTELNEALAAAFAAGNFDAIGPFYTEDAILLPPRGRAQEGRAAASAFWQSVASRFASCVYTTATVKDFGDAARRETGSFAMSAGDGQTVEGKYVLVWQLVDGEWQIESAIWNRSTPPGAAGQGRGRGQGGQGQRRPGGQGTYRPAGQGAGGYRQGMGRPSFQQAGGGIGGRRPGGGRQGGPGGVGPGRGGPGGGSLYEGDAGLYTEPKG